MSEIDLHTHSAFSDGVYAPDALCAMACRKGVRVLALCDHDTLDGLASMTLAAEAAGLTFVPGVELSAGEHGTTHILGYGVSASMPTLAAALTTQRERRRERGLAILAKLSALGMPLPPTDDGAFCGRGPIARSMVAAGYVNTLEQAFERYLNPGKPAYAAYQHMTAGEAVALLASAGAVPVLAHPAELHMPQQALEALVQSLLESGLRGVEVYHPSASRRDIPAFDAMARRLGLLVTGGSDFHGDPGRRGHIGGLPSGWVRQAEDWQALQRALADASPNV